MEELLSSIPPGWSPVLRDELSERYWADLAAFVTARRAAGNVYPAPDDVFKAFELCDFDDTRVVILGQDPYHGEGQAHGLSFSVPSDVTVLPPSLKNIFTVLRDDVKVERADGNLEAWARQGVLLLNTALTVDEGAAGSHRNQGWERFTDAVITALNDRDERVVFVLWGGKAKRKRRLITNQNHRWVESPHPSPRSAWRGFMQSRPFSDVDALLAEDGQRPIDWASP